MAKKQTEFVPIQGQTTIEEVRPQESYLYECPVTLEQCNEYIRNINTQLETLVYEEFNICKDSDRLMLRGQRLKWSEIRLLIIEGKRLNEVQHNFIINATRT
jgi:hypothetical protein